MSELDHWHPVATREELGSRPLRVELCDREIAIFRTAQGRLGAIENICPHRGMRLSEGTVSGERLVCAYHGWAWGTDGHGLSPGNPRSRPCTTRYDVVERWGALWIKNAGSPAAFPVYDAMGLHEVMRKRYRVDAPLEVVLDNFTEVEHTGDVHAILGYPSDRMDEVESRVESFEDRVHVYNQGPQKKFPRFLRKLFRVELGDHFVDEWTTRFSPVHTVYDQYWVDPASGERRPTLLRAAVFFNPVDVRRTDIFAFIYSSEAPWGRFGLNLLLYPMTRFLADLELQRDVTLLRKLGSYETSLKGRQLGRFDRALPAHRQRIDGLYRGRRTTGRTPNRIES